MPVATKKLKSNKSWIHRHVTDPYVKKSKEEGYRARSAYKLLELDEKEHFLHPGAIVVDLGSAPGSWTQVARKRLSTKEGKLNGKIIAMDILPMEPVEDVIFIQGDFREDEIMAQLGEALCGKEADVVLSDMAPNLSGIAAVDAMRCEYLNELALDFALKHLSNKGIFVIKAFQGSGFSQYVEKLKKHFQKVYIKKPNASRDSSAEVYLVSKILKNK